MARDDCVRARIATGLPRDTPPELIGLATQHAIQSWWPQLCRSSRVPAIAQLNMFDPAWYNSDGLLDICNPAYGKILTAFGTAYVWILKKYPDDDVKSFSMRWRVHRHLPGNVTEAKLYIMREYEGADGVRKMRGFRVTGPAAGWLDFRKELAEMRAKRDGEDKGVTETGEDKVTDPRTLLATSRVAVPTDHGALAHSSTKKQTIADKLKEALLEELPCTEPASENDKNVKQVDEWDDYVMIDHDEYLKPYNPAASPGSKNSTPSSTKTPSTLLTATDDDAFEEEYVAEWDDYVMVGENDDDDEVVKLVLPYAYKYDKKHDAVKPVGNGWFRGWFSN